jgi:hypothetical protein
MECECIDFSSWIAGNFAESDYLIVKMDIEGSEYAVLDKMASDGTLGWVDELYVEWHERLVPYVDAETHRRFGHHLRWHGKVALDWRKTIRAKRYLLEVGG